MIDHTTQTAMECSYLCRLWSKIYGSDRVPGRHACYCQHCENPNGAYDCIILICTSSRSINKLTNPSAEGCVIWTILSALAIGWELWIVSNCTFSSWLAGGTFKSHLTRQGVDLFGRAIVGGNAIPKWWYAHNWHSHSYRWLALLMRQNHRDLKQDL